MTVHTSALQEWNARLRSEGQCGQRSVARGGLNTLFGWQWHLVLQAFDYACAYCGVVSDEMQMDHVEPIARGGDHAVWNVVPACRSCNSSKSAKDLEDWCRSRGISFLDVTVRIELARSRMGDRMGRFLQPTLEDE